MANKVLTNNDIGTSAALDAGTSANNVVQLNGSGELPAVSGANLTDLPSSSGGTYPLNIYESPKSSFTANSIRSFTHNLGLSQTDVRDGKYKVFITGGYLPSSSSTAGYQYGDTRADLNAWGADGYDPYPNTEVIWSSSNPSSKRAVNLYTNTVKIKVGAGGVRNAVIVIQQTRS